ncbi:MAG: hypothetical protein ACUVS7_14125, partial [Bryobacteraceae bacterium]
MWQKLGLAFLAGGIAVGTVVYLGLKQRAAPAGEEAALLVQPAAPTATLPTTEAREVPPQAQAEASPPVSVPSKGWPPKTAPGKVVPARAASRAVATPATDRPAPSAPATEQARVLPPPPQEIRISPPQTQESAPAPVAEPPRQAAVEKPEPPKREPRRVTIPAGTLITVRLRDALSTERHSTHDPFFATLDAPLIVEGLVIAERGAMVRGRVIEAVSAGRVKGRAALVLALDELSTSDGQKVEIRTDSFRHEAESGLKSDVAKTGVAAGIGAAIGAIAGGGRGAAIG